MSCLYSHNPKVLSGRDKTCLTLKLIPFVSGAFGDPSHLRCMNAVELVFAGTRLSQQPVSQLRLRVSNRLAQRISVFFHLTLDCRA